MSDRAFLNEQVLAPFAERLARDGYVQLEGFLCPEVAQQLHEQLAGVSVWDLALTGPAGPVAVSAQELKQMSPAHQARMMENLRLQARRGFSFLYCRRDVEPGQGELAEDWRRWLLSAPALAWFKQLTGDADLVRADAHACRYQPGHFLRTHDDTYVGKARRFAYVLNLSRQWQPDWGGLLHMLKEERQVQVFTPVFNSLCVFRVPQDHCVSQVASFAREPRLSITGWLFASQA